MRDVCTSSEEGYTLLLSISNELGLQRDKEQCGEHGEPYDKGHLHVFFFESVEHFHPPSGSHRRR